MGIKIHKKLAKAISYGAKRSRKDILFIVIHYTGCKRDTAKNEADYFASGNTRTAGAHFFVDRKGVIYKTINMNRIAWSVGGLYSQKDGAGSYYKKCTNANSVSIELCDIMDQEPSKEQIAATKYLVKYIKKYCPNANKIIRHWDVNGKVCPARMAGTKNARWEVFKKEIESK